MKQLKKISTNLYKCKNLFFPYYRELRLLLGLKVQLKTSDRHFLEEIIFPWINNQKKVNKILFIGTAPYTKHYLNLIKKQIHTIDIDPSKARFGHKHNHVVGSALNLSEFYDDNFFDVIICNGVVGHGVDDIRNFNELIKSISLCLSDKGFLILGLHMSREPVRGNISHSNLNNYFSKFLPSFDCSNLPNIKIEDYFLMVDEIDYGYFFLNKYLK